MALSKEAIFAADDLETIEEDVPEWGGTVKLRTMSGKEREQYFRALMKHKADDIPKNLFQTLVIICAVDDDGNQLFKMEDLPELSKKNGAVLDRLTKAAGDLNGLTDQSVDDLAGE